MKTARRAWAVAAVLAAGGLVEWSYWIASGSFLSPMLGYEWDGYWRALQCSLGRAPLLFGAFSRGAGDHPALYWNALGLALAVFGRVPYAARMANWFAIPFLGVSAALVALGLSRRLRERPAWALAFALTLTAPAVIQPALLTDGSDGSLLALFLTLFWVPPLLTGGWRSGSKPWPWLASTAFAALAFGCKTNTSAVLFLVFAVVACLRPREWRWAAEGFGAASAGFVLFLGGWWLYCRHMGMLDSYWESLRATAVNAAGGGELAAGWMHKGLPEVLRAVLWVSPFFAVVWLAEGWSALRDRGQPRELLAARVFACLIFAVYAAFGFLNNSGVLKYGAPALPVLFALTARRTKDEGDPSWKLAVALAFGILWDGVFAGDPIRTINWGLRLERALGFSGAHSLKLLAVQLGASAVPLAFIAWALGRFRVSWRLALVLTGVCYNVSLSLHQRAADYATLTGYGTRGFLQVVGRLANEPRRGRIAARPDLLWMLHSDSTGDDPFATELLMTKNDDSDLLAMLDDRSTKFFVFGIAVNTEDQVRRYLSDPRFVALLSRDYKGERIGDYWLFERRLGEASP